RYVSGQRPAAAAVQTPTAVQRQVAHSPSAESSSFSRSLLSFSYLGASASQMRRTRCVSEASDRLPTRRIVTRHAITLATDQEIRRHWSLTFDVDLTSALQPVR